MTTSLLHIMGNFQADAEKAEKASFNKAMEERIKKDGYTVSDLMYEVYVCQKQIAKLKMSLAASGLFTRAGDMDCSLVATEECDYLYETAEDALDKRYEKEQIEKCALKTSTKKVKSATKTKESA